MITSIEWKDGKVRFLDQTRLPFEEVYVETDDHRRVAQAIRSLEVRGAPAIGVAAAFAAVLALRTSPARTPEEARAALDEAVRFLSGTRPTAVNLFGALRRITAAAERAPRAASHELSDRLLREALAMAEEERRASDLMGTYGATLLPPAARVLTHCNTGSLATVGEGTALAVVKKAAALGGVQRVYVDETRPLLQGARLTAWELVREGIPSTLITDSTAATVLRQHSVDAVFVGADRICANGDTANKIGTYPLAVLARRHGVPFYVVAPLSTVDFGTADGASVRIEERDSREVTHVGGTRIAAEGVDVFAPAFDVTPADLIDAIVTERGILRPPLQESLARTRLEAAAQGANVP